MKLKTLIIPSTALLLSVLIFVLVDTGPYRKAKDELDKAMPEGKLAEISAAQASDLKRFSACDKRDPATGGFVYSNEVRECLINGMPGTKTVMGGLAFGVAASEWLKANPNDEEMRSAALGVIKEARAELFSMIPLYDALGKAKEVYNRSIIMRMSGAFQGDTDQFNTFADLLDRLEYRVIAPNVAHEQDEWRQAAYTGKLLK